MVIEAGEDKVFKLKQIYVRYGAITPKKMITHLCDITGIQMTALQEVSAIGNMYCLWDWGTMIFTCYYRLGSVCTIKVVDE